MTKTELKTLLKTDKISFEYDIALKDLTDDEAINLLDYPSYFTETKQNLPSNKYGILDKLIEEKFVFTKNYKYYISNLGAILFGRKLSNFEKLSRRAVRIIFYKNNNRLNTIKEYECNKGYAVDFEGLVEYMDNL